MDRSIIPNPELSQDHYHPSTYTTTTSKLQKQQGAIKIGRGRETKQTKTTQGRKIYSAATAKLSEDLYDCNTEDLYTFLKALKERARE